MKSSLFQKLSSNSIFVDSKNWAFRAIQDRFTVLSDEELADFLNLARCNTYAYFMTGKPNKTYLMCLAASATSKDHIDMSNLVHKPLDRLLVVNLVPIFDLRKDFFLRLLCNALLNLKNECLIWTTA